jgi:hypothetical protein
MQLENIPHGLVLNMPGTHPKFRAYARLCLLDQFRFILIWVECETGHFDKTTRRSAKLLNSLLAAEIPSQ